MLETECRSEDAKVRHVQQGLGLGRKGPEALAQFISQPINVAGCERPRQSPVQIQLHVVVGHEAVGEMRRTVQHHVRRRGLLRHPLAPQTPHRLLQPPHVEVEADRVGVARLLRPQQIAGAADLEVLERDPVAGAEIGMMLEHLQPFLGVGVDRVGHQQVAVGPSVRAPHATAQLIQL